MKGTNGLDAAVSASALPKQNKKSEREMRPDLVWWWRMDSNHRSETQQIYSLPPLATRELHHILF